MLNLLAKNIFFSNIVIIFYSLILFEISFDSQRFCT